MGDTTIQWTNKTWNPVRGCSRVSQGCVNCYAERQAARFAGPGKPFEGFVRITNGHPQWTGKMALVEKHLQDPLHWREPRMVFVNSMSDLFHEALPDEAIDQVFAVMALCPQHTFQILTKRPERMLKWTQGIEGMVGESARDALIEGTTQALYAKLHPGEDPSLWLAVHQPLPNVWLGVSVEDQATADERIPLLLQTPAAVRFVSYEPALGPVDFTALQPDREVEIDALTGHHGIHRPLQGDNHKLDWVIVGGESGPGARSFDTQWARNTIAQCKAAGLACFVKQLGGKPVGPCLRCNGAGTIITWEDGMPGGAECPDFCYGTKDLRLKLVDRKGGDMTEWPSDLRVREMPNG